MESIAQAARNSGNMSRDMRCLSFMGQVYIDGDMLTSFMPSETKDGCQLSVVSCRLLVGIWSDDGTSLSRQTKFLLVGICLPTEIR